MDYLRYGRWQNFSWDHSIFLRFPPYTHCGNTTYSESPLGRVKNIQRIFYIISLYFYDSRAYQSLFSMDIFRKLAKGIGKFCWIASGCVFTVPNMRTMQTLTSLSLSAANVLSSLDPRRHDPQISTKCWPWVAPGFQEHSASC